MKYVIFMLALISFTSAAPAQRVFTYLADFKNGQAYYGFGDSAGNTKTNGIYNLIFSSVNGICVVKGGMTTAGDYDNQRAGYSRYDGTELVPMLYGDAKDMSEGMGAVQQPGKLMDNKLWGFVNDRGKEVIAPRYKYAKSFHNGLAAVATDEKKWCYIDKTGTVKIPGPFLDANDFSEGLAGVSVPKDLGSGVMSFAAGYIDMNGTMVIKPAYNYVFPFSGGVAVVKFSGSGADGTYKNYALLIDKTGKRLTSKEYVSIASFYNASTTAAQAKGSEGLGNETDEWVILDKTGKELPYTIKGYQPDIRAGIFPIQKGNKYGFADNSGKTVIEPIYNDAHGFSEGLAAVQLTDKGPWGYINKAGKMIIAPQPYLNAGFFSDGAAVVQKGQFIGDLSNEAAVIDNTGKVIIPFAKQSIDPFEKGRAVASKSYISYYIDKAGRTTLAADIETLNNMRYGVKAISENRIREAYDNFKKAADKNYAPAQYYLGYIMMNSAAPLQNKAEGEALLLKAANAGVPEAMYMQAAVYGTSTAPDYEKAFTWYSAAEKKGVAVAARDLGIMYEAGMGREKDAAKAAAHYQIAADAYDAQALYRLGMLYLDGRGVTKSVSLAKEMISLSAKLNYQPAIAKRQELMKIDK